MIKYNFFNIILFLFLKTEFCYSYSINQNKNTLDAMAQAGHDNKEGHASSPSQLLTQLAGKISKILQRFQNEIQLYFAANFYDIFFNR